MLKALKSIVLALGLVFVVIAFSGVKYIGHSCHLTAVLGGPPTCDSNIQWDDQSPVEP
jgi:hypothetical protein